MASARIAAAIRTIPEKKEDLLSAFELLQSQSSVASFTLNWKDLNAHISAIESSINERFKELQAKEAKILSAVAEEKPATSAAAGESPEAAPCPELVSLCANMDGKGLRSFVASKKRRKTAIQRELTTLFQSLPNPALLVLEAVDDFFALTDKGDPLRAIWRTCIELLERIVPETESPVRERAKDLAMEWKGKINDAESEDDLEAAAGSSFEERNRNLGMEYRGESPMDTEEEMRALLFLQLVSSYGLSSEFEADDLLNAFTRISWGRKQACVLYKKSSLTERAPDFIQKLIDKSKQLDAVRFVYCFNLMDKFPPVPLLKAYLRDHKKLAKEVRKKGNNSIESQNVAIVKEHGSLKSVLRAIELHKLESEYPPDVLEEQLIQTEKQYLLIKTARKKAGRKRLAAAAGSVSNQKGQQQQKQQSSKRSRPSTMPPAPAFVPHHPQLFPPPGMVPYAGFAGPGPGPGPYPYHPGATGPFYNHQGPPFWNPYWSGRG